MIAQAGMKVLFKEMRREQVGGPTKYDAFMGTFQRWGEEYEEFENGPGNTTVAIVIDAKGVVHTPSAAGIHFLGDTNDKA